MIYCVLRSRVRNRNKKKKQKTCKAFKCTERAKRGLCEFGLEQKQCDLLKSVIILFTRVLKIFFEHTHTQCGNRVLVLEKRVRYEA